MDANTRTIMMHIAQAIFAAAAQGMTMEDTFVPQLSLEGARQQLRGNDGPRRHAPRKVYSLPKKLPQRMINSLTPAGRRVIDELKTKPSQSLGDLIAATGLGKKTVENILVQMRAAKLLVTGAMVDSAR